MSGKAVRLRRIFKEDGRAVISALDFAGFMGPVPGLEVPKEITAKVVRGGADAIIAHPGFAREAQEAYGGKAGLIMRITGGCSPFAPDASYHLPTCSVEEAVRLGADAVCVMVIMGAPQEHAMLATLGKTAEEAARLGIPVVAELLPQFDHSYDPQWVGVSARLGFELGADVIKAYYCGDAFADVVKSCPIPIVMAGGPKSADIFTNIEKALQAGAAGVAIGRNIFQAPDPEGYTKKIVELVHGGTGDGK